MLTPEVKRRRTAALDGPATAPQRAVPDPGPPCRQCGAGFMVRTRVVPDGLDVRPQHRLPVAVIRSAPRHAARGELTPAMPSGAG